MTKKEILKKTEDFVKEKMSGEGTGHDFWHVVRVRNTALKIAKEEKVDLYIVELASLLHDIADHKFYDGDRTVGPKIAREFLENLGVDNKVIEHVINIISNMSFHKSIDGKTLFTSKELKVVQDADKLDAMGAIGIARAFAYGGLRQREIHNPNIKVVKYKTSREYNDNQIGKTTGTTINHFYEKLLKLKSLMNTKAGKRIANQRHKFLELYLKNFFAEREGKK